MVFGLSGGLDSSVAGILCHRAMGDASLGAIMPCGGHPRDLEDAQLLAEEFGIPTMTVDLRPVLDAVLEALPPAGGAAVSNLKPRLRMASLYYIANDKGYLVAGTGNRSELGVGYFTKYGDGGADILPLAGIYKTDLFEMARDLGVPERIIGKPPSAGLWEGQTDEGEMGIEYEELDHILKALDAGVEPEADARLVEKVKRMIASSHHKRCPVPRFTPVKDE